MPKPLTRVAMKVTTLRFGPDLWELLEREAETVGVSVSQYVREAALARAASAAGARGEAPFALLASSARALAQAPDMPPDQRLEIERALASLARALARERRDEAGALRAQAGHAKARAHRAQPGNPEKGAGPGN